MSEPQVPTSPEPVITIKQKRKSTKPDLGIKVLNTSSGYVVVNETSQQSVTNASPNQNLQGSSNSNSGETHEITNTERKGIKLSTKTKRLINAFSTLNRYYQKTYLNSLARAFNSFKYKLLLQTPIETNKTDNAIFKKEIDYRVEYLKLYEENEKLRYEVVNTFKEAHEKSIKKIFISLIRKRFLFKLKSYFERWCQNSNIKKMLASINLRETEAKIAFQRINRETAYIQGVKEENAKLKAKLFLYIYYSHWKATTQASLLAEEREKYDVQKKAIYKELKRMRGIVKFTNNQESRLLEGVIQRGSITTDNIQLLQSKLEDISNLIEKNRKLKDSLTNSNLTSSTLLRPESSISALSVSKEVSMNYYQNEADNKSIPSKIDSPSKLSNSQIPSSISPFTTKPVTNSSTFSPNISLNQSGTIKQSKTAKR